MDKSNEWIFEHLEKLKKYLIAAEVAKELRVSPEPFRDKAEHTAFSILMIVLGEHTPKRLWGVSDYSVLYGMIADDKDLSLQDDY